jgi:spore coat polysaccharide biosynthesis predicted glycosyltransferase SpsG
MNITIRTDASTRIGLGHLVCCRTLATALRDQGATVRFICRAHPGHQLTALRADGWGLAALPAPPIQEDVADGDYADWEWHLRPHIGLILVIDDLANRRHDGDLLLDQNYAPAGTTRYQGLLPPGARTLLGPAYALLRPEYAQHRQTLRPRNG